MLQKMVVEVIAEGPTMEGVLASLMGLQAHTPGVAITVERQVFRQNSPPEDTVEEMLRGIIDYGSSL